MIETDFVENSIAEQSRTILCELLADAGIAEAVKQGLRARMAERPDEPDRVLLEVLVERQRHLASCPSPLPPVRHQTSVWPMSA